MDIFRFSSSKKQHKKPPPHSVCVIGSFDGLHKGHQELIKKAKALAVRKNLPFGVITFYPHPQCILQNIKTPFSILSKKIRIIFLKRVADYIVFIRFNHELMNMSPENFIQEIIIQYIRPAHIFVGENFLFGHSRRGNIQLLEQYQKNAYQLHISQLMKNKNNNVYSSSFVRKNIKNACIQEILPLLGYHWCIMGRVQKGAQRGKTINVPTANICFNNIIEPRFGVYAVHVFIKKYGHFNAVANFGINPTFNGTLSRLEVHIFDFNKNIYGEELRVSFIEFIRLEKFFPSKEALIIQIMYDIQKAKIIKKKYSNGERGAWEPFL